MKKTSINSMGGAIVTPLTPGGRRSLAWCDTCQDGVRAYTRRATMWATTHNDTHHHEDTK